MKKTVKLFFLFLISASGLLSCTDNDDVTQYSTYQIQNFIWKGLNAYYLYQPQITDLSDARFSNQQQLDGYLANFSDPNDLFENLILDRENTDKYSVLFSNYIALEQILSGTTKNNGVEYGLTYKSGSTTDIFGYVKYILPNSDASTKAIQRGTIFYAVNGTPLTISNYRSLLGSDSYTLNFADYDSGNITPNGQSVALTKTAFSENPVLIKKVIPVGAKKVGYLVYNGFYGEYETELNAAFAYFKSENVTDLVLDLRYNGGGSIDTANRLGTMITGQFSGQIYAQQQWNPKIQPRLNPNESINIFETTTRNGAAINSLNLSKVYILTTRNTASASELVINCLDPYINVVQIGTTTTGKNVGSITMYDSPTFRKENVNPNHTYAMQPIVLKIVNKNGFGDYTQGISPDASNVLAENLSNLGELGNPTEPLLSKALGLAGLRISSQNNVFKIHNEIIDTSVRDLTSEMYLENTLKK
ncbi:S41 family peptidase [Flavobacterium sp.]|uniref:S41 family peptidase n=1 Tax=Flavobacterium sp. TaxID=239 RepID=UPI00286E57CE|nr:S41 family peptidase [Flavobacterium sp.]